MALNMRFMNSVKTLLVTATILLASISPAAAQQHAHARSDSAKATAKVESVTVVPGKQYAKGSVYRWFFGDAYRDLWTTPIRVPVLDIRTYAGGLHPTKEGGGNQTKSLRFETADGQEYVFRLSKKTVNTAPKQVRGTPLAGIIEDEVSQQHPAGAVMSAPIVAATGILHPTPKLMVMAGDSSLGKFHDDFAGRLGMLEEYPNVPKEEGVGFGGASKIIDSEDLLKLLNTDASEHVDAPAFLTARLTDFLINDNDRHGGNWKWARFKGEKDQWEPIARDRDHAFGSIDGVVLTLAHLAMPVLVKFDDTPNVPGLTQPRGFDARLLAGLEKPVWDSVARALQARITDSVIDAAVHTMPREFQSTAPRLAAILKARRAAIPKSADEFYRLLAERVPIHGADHAVITRRNDGFVDVRLASAGKQYFSRRFNPSETVELLVYLHGGNDTAVVVGDAPRSILVRVIGGNG